MRIPKRTFPYISVFLIAALAGCEKDKSIPPEVSQLLRQTVKVKALPASLKDQKELQKAWSEMGGFYAKRGFQPAWFTPDGLRPQAAELIQAIPALGADGLEIRRYQPARLQALVDEMKETKSFDDPETQRRLVDLDVELTYTYLSLATHLANGRLQPEKLRVEWYTKPRNVDLDARLGQAVAAEDAGEIVRILRSLTPPHPDYQRLAQALAAHRAIAAKGGWGTVPAGPDLEKDDRGPRVAALRHRLSIPGGDVFDAALAAAVSRFQQRHGLEVTGKVDEGYPGGAQRARPGPHPPDPGQHGALALAAGHLRRPLHPGQRPRVQAGPLRGRASRSRRCGWWWARSRAARRCSATR